MKKIKDQYVNELVRMLVNPDMRSTDGLVIAGGFATALYWFYRKPLGERKNIVKQLKTAKIGYSEVQNLKSKFSDIDFWILNGSDADKIMKQYTEKDEEGNLAFIQPKHGSSPFLGMETYKATRFAVSYIAGYTSSGAYSNNTNNTKHQVIRFKTYDKLEDIFADYDISICKTAWYKDTLYVSSETEYDFITGTINTSIPLTEHENTFSRVWSSMRLLKYHQRYGFEPTDKASEELYQIMIEGADFLNESVEIQKNKKIKELFGNGFVFPKVQPRAKPNDTKTVGSVSWSSFAPKHEIDDPYDKYRERSVYDMRNLYGNLLSMMPIFLSLEWCTLARSMAFLDLGNEASHVLNHVKQYIESGGTIYEFVDDNELDLFDFGL